MDLEKYFADRRGIGILTTADKDGKVNGAVYSRPHFTSNDTAAFVMRDRLTHHNSLENPYAAYLFVEEGSKARGMRLYLRKIAEETDSEKIENMQRRKRGPEEDKPLGPKFLVSYKVEKILPLIGTDLDTIDL